MRGRRPQQLVRLGSGPGCQWWQSLTLPLVFSVPEYLRVCVTASVSMSGQMLCLSLGLALHMWVSVFGPPS